MSAERKRVASGATTEDEVIVIKNLVKVCMYASFNCINVISNRTTSPRLECVVLSWTMNHLIGASLNEPHTSMKYVCALFVYVCMVCIVPYMYVWYV